MARLVALPCLALVAPAHAWAADYAAADRVFDEYRLDAHVPGLVYGIVADGRLVHVRAFGVQEVHAMVVHVLCQVVEEELVQE